MKEKIKEKHPLVHCIMGGISANFCANGLLAIGARPVMAQNPCEVKEITASADALLINLAGITRERASSAKIALKTAEKKGIPVAVDAVGVACSRYRRRLVKKLVRGYRIDVLKGNYSEIMALYSDEYSSKGVDADASADLSSIEGIVKRLASRLKLTVMATGKTDVVSDGKRTVLIKNGTKKLASVTGTGCLLGAICTAFITQADPIDGAVYACGCLGVCGEMAEAQEGVGSYLMCLLDMLSSVGEEEIVKRMKVEEK